MHVFNSASSCGGAAVTLIRSDYHMTMMRIRIVDLKSRLSEHLRKVRADRLMTILDGDTPIARIVPWKAGNGFLNLRAPLPARRSFSACLFRHTFSSAEIGLTVSDAVRVFLTRVVTE